MGTKKTKIFISYSWKENGIDIADQLYADLSDAKLKDKVKLLMDRRDITYKFSIEEFMATIRKADYAILLVNSHYLQSLNCMKEVLHAFRDQDCKKKLLPILIGKTDVFSVKGRTNHVTYWQKEIVELEEEVKGLNPTSGSNIREDLYQMKEIEHLMDAFLKFISDVNLLTFEQLKEEQYDSLLKYCKIATSKETVTKPSIVDKRKHILEQTYDALSVYFAYFSYIPIRRFRLFYPFNSKGYADYSNGRLRTDNEELFNLFVNIKKIQTDKADSSCDSIKSIDEYEKKIQYICDKMLHNGIEAVNFNNKRIEIQSYNKEVTECYCTNCLFTRFNYDKIFKILEDDSDSGLDMLMLRAFLHYKIGNFVTSYGLFEKCVALASKNRNVILKYISELNNQTLNRFINRTVSFDESWHLKQYKERRSIIPTEYAISKTGFDEDFFDWIGRRLYFNEEFYNMDDFLNKIRHHYDLSQNGGYSFNSNLESLLSAYYNLHNFLNLNLIIFDYYNDFKHIVHKFFEGLILLLAIPKEQSGINQIGNNELSLFIYYVDTKYLQEIVDKYKVSSIKCSDTGIKRFVDDFANYCFCYSDIFEKIVEKDNSFFYNRRSRILSNFFIIADKLPLGSNELNEFSNSFLLLIHKWESINSIAVPYIINFLYHQAGKMDLLIFTRFLQKIASLTEFHRQPYLNHVAEILIKHKIEVNKLLDYDQVLAWANEQCPVCGHVHELKELIPLLSLFHSDGARLEELVSDKLEIEFDCETYYYAVKNGIIDYLQFWDRFSERCISKTIEKPSQLSSLLGPRNIFGPNPYFGMMIDICFLMNIDVSDSRFDEIRHLHGFYEWMLNLNDFDYEKFDVEWLKIYTSDHFAQRYTKAGQIKPIVKKYLKDNKDRLLESYYIHY